MRRVVIVLAFALAACGGKPAVDIAPDVAAIEAQMHARFDRPDARLDAGPVVVSGDHAVADWTQGPMGGRALFERREGKWALVLCSGDALKQIDRLKQARVPDADAEAIVRELGDAEKHVQAERLARMRSFTGTVTADQMPARS
ncbi:copper uptake system-associated protein [Sphingomonas sp.]|jgi:predicted small lipoprotein YifL|uniref:copper uptake system-associated protein n=1 Tax=Sphingomonas sp. TaxID=28214 RepID=UPI0035C79320